MSKASIGFSHLTGRIYAFVGGKEVPGRRSCVVAPESKTDITEDVIILVGLHMLHGLPDGFTGSDCTFDHDGEVYRLSVMPAEEETTGVGASESRAMPQGAAEGGIRECGQGKAGIDGR